MRALVELKLFFMKKLEILFPENQIELNIFKYFITYVNEFVIENGKRESMS